MRGTYPHPGAPAPMRHHDSRYYVLIGGVIVGLRDTVEEAEALVVHCEQRGMLAVVVGPEPDGGAAGNCGPPPDSR